MYIYLFELKKYNLIPCQPVYILCDFRSQLPCIQRGHEERLQSPNSNPKKGTSEPLDPDIQTFVTFDSTVCHARSFSSPLQTIPVILDGKDMVAMARTGSGKTAAFLVPMFEKLKAPQAQTGARALILTPTRELALQTMKFTKEVRRVDQRVFIVFVG